MEHASLNRKPQVTLLMIVKNEERQIQRCLTSAIPLISDWLIIDTGSTDSTKEIIEKTLVNIPGRVISKPWVNFGHNRSELLDEFYKSRGEFVYERFLLLLDADCEIVNINVEKLRAIPEADQLLIRVSGSSLEYRMPYFIRTRKKFRYVGATHEYLACDVETTRSPFDGFDIFHHADGGSREGKLTRDRTLLMQELQREPNNSRNHFYLGQTLNDLGELDSALAHYMNAFKWSQWREERFQSALRSGRIAEGLKRQSDAILFYHQAIQVSPERSEAYYYLGALLNQLELYSSSRILLERAITLSPSEDILFVERWIENWGLKMEYGVSLWWNQEREIAAEIFKSISMDLKAPPGMRKLAQENLSKC